MDRLKVLCVDDEPNVLQGLALHLRRIYEVASATSGPNGLELLSKEGPFAVVLSDMQMPVMNGAAFLARVRESYPDTTRMLLTGHADMQAAISAVNDGQIFRFLTKPCPPDQLRLAFEAAVRQYQLVTAERVLLEQTLHGAVKALTDVLALTSPLAFGRAGRVRKHVSELAHEVALENRWQLEVAAMLSHLGSITIPEDTLKKHYFGKTLGPDEAALIARIPTVTDSFLASIPRLEPVREILSRHTMPFSRFARNGADPDVSLTAASILRIAVAYDELESSGISTQMALDTMRGREGAYHPAVLEIFARLRGAATKSREVRDVPLKGLTVGMVLTQDVYTRGGLLLVTRGFEVTSSFLQKVQNFQTGHVREPLSVIIPPAAPARAQGNTP